MKLQISIKKIGNNIEQIRKIIVKMMKETNLVMLLILENIVVLSVLRMFYCLIRRNFKAAYKEATVL